MEDQIQIKRSVCHQCHDSCYVDLVIRNGRFERQQGPGEEKRAPGDEWAVGGYDPSLAEMRRRVTACSRARHMPELYYHPGRTKFPLKRAGERGEGKWQQISWEQALDEIAAKLAEIRDKYGPEAVTNSHGTGRTDDAFRTRFFNLFGSPNGIGQGSICYGPNQLAAGFAVGGVIGRNSSTINTKCILCLGTNPDQARRRHWLAIRDYQKAGCKLIVVDPRKTALAERADIWLQLRPGTDAALYLSMINIIIEEGLYNKEFVNQWCYGFDKLRERAREYPPEKVQEITWVPAEKIRAAARIYATTKPAAVESSMGLEHIRNGIEALHCRYIFPALTGNFDIVGGEEFRGHPKDWVTDYEIELNELVTPEIKAKQIGADRFKLSTFPGYDLIMKNMRRKVGRNFLGPAHAPSVYRAMLTGKPYPVRAMITVSSNPMVTQANTKLVYKALKSLDLYVVSDYFITPSAELADYVLPAAMWLERPIAFNYWDTRPWLQVAETVMPARVEGQWDRRNDYDLWQSLGIRLGQEKYWPWGSLEEAFDYRLKATGKTLKQWVAEGGLPRPPKVEKKYETEGFGTPTGKIELYSTVLERLGYDPLPRYYEPAESPVNTPQLYQGYPLILITGGRHLPYFHSEYRQVDSLRKEHPHPIMQINPSTAVELGIRDGDWAWIETPRGRVRQQCQYFDGIDPRVVHAEHGWWFPELPGEEPWLHGVWESNINVVTDDDPDKCGPMNGGWPLRAMLCKVYRAKVY